MSLATQIVCEDPQVESPALPDFDGRPLAEIVSAATWYQSLALPGGIVTPGNFDTLRELRSVPFPASLRGKRCLDVGTANGFWAFEMERRGADAVLAIDLEHPHELDWPGPPTGHHELPAVGGSELTTLDAFSIAHQALGSSVERRAFSIYDLSADSVGRFDFIFIGSLLLHLRDPVGALASVRRVLRGELLSVDAISLLLTMQHPRQPIARLEAPGWPLWWVLNLAAYRRLFPAAGLQPLQTGRPFIVRRSGGPEDAPRTTRRLAGPAQRAIAARWGIPHAWVRARPSMESLTTA